MSLAAPTASSTAPAVSPALPNTGSGDAAPAFAGTGMTIAGMSGGAETQGLVVAGQLVGLVALAANRLRRARSGTKVAA